MTKISLEATTGRCKPMAWLLAALLVTSGVAQAECIPIIPLTRPDSRYEAVAGADPAGSEVRDKVTGLIWQRCMQGVAWINGTCTGTATTHTWTQALEVARNATPSKATGATAWRLPNHAELFSLADRACYSPAINTTWFPVPFFFTMWSSSPKANNSDKAWVVDFDNGNYNGFLKNNTYYVRLVRSGQ